MELFNRGQSPQTTTIPAITYVMVGVTSVILAYFTAMDKGGETAEIAEETSATNLLPAFGESSAESEPEPPTEPESEPESEPEYEPEEAEPIPEPEPEEKPAFGGKKKKRTRGRRSAKKNTRRHSK